MSNPACPHRAGSSVAAAFRPPPPGAQWRQFDIGLVREAGSALASARALFGALAPLLRAGSDDGRLLAWFFMRKPPDVRLRVLLSEIGEPLASALRARLADVRDQGLIRGSAAGRYRPETDRFGGPQAMALAHGYFYLDSRLWLAVGPCGATPVAARSLLPALLHDLFQRCCGGARAVDAWRALDAEIAAGTGFPGAGQAQRPVTLASLGTNVGLGPGALAALGSYALANATYARRLHDLALPQPSLARVAATVGLFSLNRHGVDGRVSGPLAAGILAGLAGAGLTASHPL